MSKHILITGSAGFIGSHLCKKLLDEGNEILCLDNFYTGTKANILKLTSNPYFEVIRHDVIIPMHLEVDEIYNLACTDISLAKSKLGWEPHVKLEEGLVKTIEYFKEKLL